MITPSFNQEIQTYIGFDVMYAYIMLFISKTRHKMGINLLNK